MSQRPYPNLTGQTFGRLVVMRESDSSRPGNRVWTCECSCGVVKDYSKSNLTGGRSQSCGCFRVESTRAIGQMTTHGMRNSPEYTSWVCMKDRCLNPAHVSYSIYGGRGIYIHESWIHSFEQFLSHVGRKPVITHTLDRIDPDGNYVPGNVRWADIETQANNRRSCHYLTMGVKTLTLSQWARELSIPESTILARYHKNLPVDDVLYVGNLRSKSK